MIFLLGERVKCRCIRQGWIQVSILSNDLKFFQIEILIVPGEKEIFNISLKL